MTESSVSKSVSATSQNKGQTIDIVHGRGGVIDKVFPLIDQITQTTKIPESITKPVSIFFLLQNVFVSLWMYTTVFNNATGRFRDCYRYLSYILAFYDITNYTKYSMTTMIVVICVAAFTIFWVLLNLIFNKKFYTIPVPMLYISSILIDIVIPIFIIPSVFVITYGIVGFNYGLSSYYVASILCGALGLIVFMSTFMINTTLRARSVVLNNTLFPCINAQGITYYVAINVVCSIISAILTNFTDWFDVILIVIHMLIIGYVIYHISMIPFYKPWKNALMMSFAFTSLVLDVNFLVLYFLKTVTYNFTVVILFISILLSFFISQLSFASKFKVLQKRLKLNTEINDVSEYFSSLKFQTRPLRATSYIVVGLANACDYFIDGSLFDYILGCQSLDSMSGILLQVLTFFPSESRKMDFIYRKILQRRKHSIVERFLIYQVYRIKMRRLVSDSKDTLEMIAKLKSMNESVKFMIRSFWDKISAKNSFISALGNKISDVDSFFKSALGNNPNNLRIHVEYANFLADCKCDFDKAAAESIRAELIGDGKNFFVDTSFRSMVNKFHIYLKKNILDIKGKKIIRKQGDDNGSKSRSTNSSSSGNMNSSGTDIISMDVERQENVCKKILKESKVRLSLNHSIKDKVPIHSKITAVLPFINLFVVLFFFIGFYVYLNTNFIWRRTCYNDLNYAGYAVFYNIYSNLYTLLNFAKDTGRYEDNDEVLGDISIDKTTVETLVPSQLTMEQKNFFCIEKSKHFVHELMNSFAAEADDADVYVMTKVFIKADTPMIVCNNAKADYEAPISLKGQLIALMYLQNTIAGQYANGEHFQNIFKSNDYCQIAANLPIITSQSENGFKAILDYNIRRSSHYDENITYWMIADAVIIFLTVSVPMAATSICFFISINKFIKVLLALPGTTKEQAKEPIIINQEDSTNVPANTKAANSYILVSVYIIFYICLLVQIGVYCGFCYNTLDLNNDLDMILNWFYYSCVRITYASKVGNNVLQLIILNESLPQTYINFTELIDQTRSDLYTLVNLNSDLQYGSDTFHGSMGYDQKLDDLQVSNQCDIGDEVRSVHDMYACSGLNKQITVIRNLVLDVVNKPEAYNGNLNDEVSQNLMHLLRFHFYPLVMRATTRVSDLLTERYDNGMIVNNLYLGIGMIVLCVLFIIPWIIKGYIDRNYKLLLMLIQHLPPLTIVNTPEILEFLSGSKKSTEEKMSTSKTIVHDASECIVITNQNAVIEIVNRSFTDNIGLTPDQMLGQHITNFVSIKDQEKMDGQIDLMMNGQGSAFWEDHIHFVNENTDVPFQVTVIGMKDSDDSDIKSIVFILMNEKEEIQKRQAAEEAKAKSEKLLYQILPKNIVVRLNRGETDISFTIPSATIFFIDIVKFSTYSAMLTPSEIMTNLSLVFATFDKIVAQYKSITKIKLIGDVYMAASGLFQEEGETINHAEDSCRCCLGCQKAMEDINAKLESSLEIRIGVNSGGPLIGGVLGSDKPTFDIIGDPINVAARLQSTDIPGNVQISGETKKMIENLDFTIEERGEIYLKGKGNQTTYFVYLTQKQEATFSLVVNSDM